MAKEMGLDRAPIEFQTFYFSHVCVTPPNQQGLKTLVFFFFIWDNAIQFWLLSLLINYVQQLNNSKRFQLGRLPY